MREGLGHVAGSTLPDTLPDAVRAQAMFPEHVRLCQALLAGVPADDLPVRELAMYAPSHVAPQRPYARRTLLELPVGEVLVMRWRPGGHTAIHDHGPSSGVVVAAFGNFVEDTIELAGYRGPRVRHTRYLGEGGVLEVGAGDFHVLRVVPSMAPSLSSCAYAAVSGEIGAVAEPLAVVPLARPSVTEAITIHVYRPLAGSMRLVDPVGRVIWRVRADHGAWLPLEPGYAIARQPWPE